MFMWLKLVASLSYCVCSILFCIILDPYLSSRCCSVAGGLFRCSAGVPDCLVFVDGVDLQNHSFF